MNYLLGSNGELLVIHVLSCISPNIQQDDANRIRLSYITLELNCYHGFATLQTTFKLCF